MANEIWKPIRGLEGYYEISSFGRVRSVGRNLPHKTFGTWRIAPRILKTAINGAGYLFFSAHLPGGGTKTISIHRAVAETFLEHPEYKSQVNFEYSYATLPSSSRLTKILAQKIFRSGKVRVRRSARKGYDLNFRCIFFEG